MTTNGPTPGQIIEQRRRRLGLSQDKVAQHMGVSSRTVERWEADQGKAMDLDQAVRLGRLLSLSLDEMAGVVPTGLDLSGTWHARWHTSRDGQRVIDAHEISAEYSYGHMNLDATGNYLWHGELRTHGYVLTGEYRSVEIDHKNEGSLYFWLHPGNRIMLGHFVGRTGKWMLKTGWGVLARDPDRATALINTLVEGGYRDLTEWPKEV